MNFNNVYYYLNKEGQFIWKLASTLLKYNFRKKIWGLIVMTIFLNSCLIPEPIDYKEREDIPPIVVSTAPPHGDIYFPNLDSLEESGSRVITFSIELIEYNTSQYLTWRAILYTQDNPVDGYNIGDHFVPPQDEDKIDRSITINIPLYYFNYPGCYKLVVGITDGEFLNDYNLEITEDSNLSVVRWIIVPERELWQQVIDIKNCNFK